MASISELMDFLMSLMRDDDTRSEFNRDPDAALADRGLADVTGQDVQDARLMMADCGAVQPRAGGDGPDRGGSRGGSGSDNDAIREIHHTTTHFEVGDVTTTIVTINDNDTVIVDSFNNDVVAIQDNDTTDVDVISIEDNDTVTEEEQEEEPEVTEGGPTEDPGPISGIGTEVEGDEVPEDTTDSGASEGFAPDPNAGFGTQPELGAEAGFTSDPEPPADEPLDELVG